jgi:hypothetical protein
MKFVILQTDSASHQPNVKLMINAMMASTATVQKPATPGRVCLEHPLTVVMELAVRLTAVMRLRIYV